MEEILNSTINLDELSNNFDHKGEPQNDQIFNAKINRIALNNKPSFYSDDDSIELETLQNFIVNINKNKKSASKFSQLCSPNVKFNEFLKQKYNYSLNDFQEFENKTGSDIFN